MRDAPPLGEPKGVVCEHRQAAAFAVARAGDEAIGQASGARVFVAARHTFDLCEVRRCDARG